MDVRIQVQPDMICMTAALVEYTTRTEQFTKGRVAFSCALWVRLSWTALQRCWWSTHGAQGGSQRA